MSKILKKHQGLDTAIFYIALIIGAIASVVIFIAKADTTPATYEDYSPLYEQVESLKQDFSYIGEMENIKSYNYDKGKLVLDGGKECDLAVYFNSNKEITFTREIDKSLTFKQYIAYIVLFFIVGLGVAFIIMTIVFGIIIIAEKISKRNKKEFF